MTPKPISVWLPDRVRQITPGLINEAACELFTKGYCAELAVALYESSHWPLCSAGHWDDYGNFVPGAHYGVLTPAADVLDIEGHHNVPVWAGRWGLDGAYQVVSLYELEQQRWKRNSCTLLSSGSSVYRNRWIRRFAKTVLDRYELERLHAQAPALSAMMR